MYRDADQNEFGKQSPLVIFDPNLGYDSEEFENTLAARMSHFKSHPQVFASEINIGGGAEWPVMAIELLEKSLPYTTALVIFFSGERILKNLKAWRELSEIVLAFMPVNGFGNRNTAAALLLGEVAKQINHDGIRLLAYRSFDTIDLSFCDIDANHQYIIETMNQHNDVSLENYTNCHGPITHAFRIALDEVDAVAIVSNSNLALYVQ